MPGRADAAAVGGPPGRLQRKVARGLTWTVIESWGRQGLNLLVFLVLARLLTPEDFGLVALAAVFVNLAQILVDQGLGDALIQRKQVRRSEIDTAFWVAVSTGAVLTVLGVVTASPAAAVLGEPALAPILRVLALTFVLAALSSIQVALLRRELRFAGLAARALAAAAGGGVVGIGLAYAGFGAWALVGQQIAAAIVSVVVLWSANPWRPAFRFSRDEFRQLFGFGAHVVGSDILSWVNRNVDNLLVGVILGTAQLGYYAVGYRILTITQTILVNVARRITFPAFVRLQHDRARLRDAFYRVTRVGSIIIFPGYVLLALTAPELTVTLFGARWAESGPVAAVLFTVGPLVSIHAFNSSLLNAIGRPDVVFRFRLVSTVTAVIAFLIAVPFGIVATAFAFVARAYLLAPLMLLRTRQHAGIPIGEHLAQLRGVAAATALMAGAVILVKFAATDLQPALLLGIELGVGLATVSACLWLIERRLLADAGELFRQAVPGRPGLSRDANRGEAPRPGDR